MYIYIYIYISGVGHVGPCRVDARCVVLPLAVTCWMGMRVERVVFPVVASMLTVLGHIRPAIFDSVRMQYGQIYYNIVGGVRAVRVGHGVHAGNAGSSCDSASMSC